MFIIAALVSLGLWFRFKTLKAETQAHILKYIHWYSFPLVILLNFYLGGDSDGRFVALLIDTAIAGYMFFRHTWYKPRQQREQPKPDINNRAWCAQASNEDLIAAARRARRV